MQPTDMKVLRVAQFDFWTHTLDNKPSPKHYRSRLAAAEALVSAAKMLLVMAETELADAKAEPEPSTWHADTWRGWHVGVPAPELEIFARGLTGNEYAD